VAGQLVGAAVLEGSGGTGTVLVPVVVGVPFSVVPGLVSVVGAPGAAVVGEDVGDADRVGVLLRVVGRVVVAVVVRVLGDVVCSTWPDPPPVPPSPLAVPAWVDGGRT
jgi:hypothetical protein